MIAFGIDCLWWDVAANAVRKEVTLLSTELRCPHCGGRCGVANSKVQFLEMLRRFEVIGFVGFREMMIWAQGKCFRNRAEAWNAYRARPLIIPPYEAAARLVR